MGLLSTWFGTSRSADNEVQRLAKVVADFAAHSLADVDSSVFDINPRTRKNAVAYHFGAIDALCADSGLSDTEVLALYVGLLRHERLSCAESMDSVTHLLAEFTGDAERIRFMSEGGDAVRRWQSGGNGSVSGHLSGLLRQIWR
jgi:hypothetical protein